MKTMTVGELKSHFSNALQDVRNGESIVLSFGRKKEKVAVIVPYKSYKSPGNRKIGLYEGKMACEFADNFKMTDDEFLRS
jgi:antitoxin (DNA-binding transcriptional repressor) of toxin-antitoxin stability system